VNESWSIQKAAPDDAAAILEIQYQAYRQEAARYGGVTLPPLLETVDALRTAMKTHVVLKALVDGVIVGSVRGQETDGTCYIGRLVVAPDYQGRGLGSALLAAIEDAFAPVRRFELFTGHLSLRNLGLYARRGYEEFRRQREDDVVTLVFVEKLT
jgi:ribosomal protein S18 acetylase RimI-like enzyme